jgi:adenosine deaminase
MKELGEKFGVNIPENFHFSPNMTLDIALGFFETSLKLLQKTDELTRVANEMVDDSLEDNVTELEVRFGPHLHQQKGLKLEEIIDAVLEGLKGRAGLILCGLYGDDPKLLEQFVEISKSRSGVVALDLAGGPASGQIFKLEDYASAFTKAREIGLGRTVHASEGRDPQEIITAITKLHAQRLGHATTLLESKQALDLVLKNNITIESCPTSNWQCGVVKDLEHHPLPKWLKEGVNVCLNTDNTFFSNINLSQEYQNAENMPGINKQDLMKCIENGFKAKFPLR